MIRHEVKHFFMLLPASYRTSWGRRAGPSATERRRDYYALLSMLAVRDNIAQAKCAIGALRCLRGCLQVERTTQALASIIQARLNRPLCLFGRMAQVDPEGLEASDG